jgi:hypothetical protein
VLHRAPFGDLDCTDRCAAPRKNKHPSPGTNHPNSHATTTYRAQLDGTTVESVVRFDQGVDLLDTTVVYSTGDGDVTLSLCGRSAHWQ